MTIFQGVILNGTEVINAPTIVGDTVFQTGDQTITFGQALAAASTRLSQDTTRAQLLLGLGTALGSQLVIGANAWIGHDYDHAAAAYPILYVHGAADPDVSNTHYIALGHNGTNAEITSGFQPILVNPGITTIDYGRITLGAASGGSILYYDPTMLQQPFFLGNAHNNLIIANIATGLGKNFDHALSANPTLFIHSAVDPDVNNTQWLSLTHDQTNAVITTGKGGFTLNVANAAADVLSINGGINTYGNVQLLQTSTIFGHSNGANYGYIFYNIANSCTNLAVGPTAGGLGTNHNLALISTTNYANNYAHAASTNPTFFVHSAVGSGVATDQWLSLTHNQTNAVITTGKGDLTLNGFNAYVSAVDVGGSPTLRSYGTVNPILCAHSTAGNIIAKIQAVGTGGYAIIGTESNHDFYFLANNAEAAKVSVGKVFYVGQTLAGATNWISIQNDATDGIISTGCGSIILNSFTEITEVCGVGLKTKEYNTVLNDDATISLPAGTGWGTFMIGDNQEYARVRWTAAAVVTLDESTANVAIADTDNNFCIYDGGATVTVKNRLGAPLTVRYVIHYS